MGAYSHFTSRMLTPSCSRDFPPPSRVITVIRCPSSTKAAERWYTVEPIPPHLGGYSADSIAMCRPISTISRSRDAHFKRMAFPSLEILLSFDNLCLNYRSPSASMIHSGRLGRQIRFRCLNHSLYTLLWSSQLVMKKRLSLILFALFLTMVGVRS